MANHLTPEELAKEMGMDRDEVVRICIEEGVPIYHGKIDKTLFQASLEAVGAGRPPPRAEPEQLGGLRALRVFALRARLASPPALPGFFAAATLALSASMRSITGATSTGSGATISSPRIFASRSARRSRRYSLASSDGLEVAGEARR